MKDLNCSISVNFEDYPDIRVTLEFKLSLIEEKKEDTLNFKKYEIIGINKKDTHCYLKYEVIEGKIKDESENIHRDINIFHIEDINVDKDFRKQGLSTKMYELLSSIYINNYSNYQITRKFVNPYAEYAFRKAVQEKNVDKLLLLNSKIIREYDPSQKAILEGLMKQLAPEYRDEL